MHTDHYIVTKKIQTLNIPCKFLYIIDKYFVNNIIKLYLINVN